MSDALDTLLETLLEQSLARQAPTRAQALSVLTAEDERVLEVVAAAGKVRRRFFSNKVKCNFLINMKSGLCPEDCSYCSQRRGSQAEILKYSWVDAKTASELADLAVSGGAKRICLVASGRGPSAKDLGRVTETVRAIKERHPGVEICVSLGLLQEGQSEQLAQAGVFAYNHNLNTAEARYDEICTTHTFADRVETLGRAQQSGLSPCSGAIFGMGEGDEDIVELALGLRGLDPDSVPINFLMPFDGTPLAGRNELSPARCLKILALFRFVFPDVEVRIAAGREMHLRSLQPLALHLANSLFLGDYLTSEGQAGQADLQMIADAGFVVEGHEEETFLPERRAQVEVRRRGPGTSVPANI